MVGGRLYLNTPTSVGAALDARTGETIWIYNPKSYEKGTTTMSARWNQRGVAYWTDGSEERIFWGTGDGYLVGVDGKTGQPVESFGSHGRVDLMSDLPQAVRGSRDWLGGTCPCRSTRQRLTTTAGIGWATTSLLSRSSASTSRRANGSGTISSCTTASGTTTRRRRRTSST